MLENERIFTRTMDKILRRDHGKLVRLITLMRQLEAPLTAGTLASLLVTYIVA